MSNQIKFTGATYVDVAETAKLLRGALKRAFPGTKFKVVSDRYAGGASINVSFSGGPSKQSVDAIVSAYRGGGFDGMIDMAYSRKAWLYPDGSAHVAECEGTEMSRGSVPPMIGEDPEPGAGAQLVRFGSDFIFVERKCTDDEYWMWVATLEKKFGVEIRHNVREDYKYQRTGEKFGRYYRHEFVKTGLMVQKIHMIESIANGAENMEGRFLWEHRDNAGCRKCVWNSFETEIPAMHEIERAERIKYGILDESPESAQAFDDEFARMVALING